MPDILAKIKAQFLERIENSDSELTWKTLQNWFTLETDDAIEKVKEINLLIILHSKPSILLSNVKKIPFSDEARIGR